MQGSEAKTHNSGESYSCDVAYLIHEEFHPECDISRERELSSKLSPLVGVLISANFWGQSGYRLNPSYIIFRHWASENLNFLFCKLGQFLLTLGYSED